MCSCSSGGCYGVKKGCEEKSEGKNKSGQQEIEMEKRNDLLPGLRDISESSIFLRLLFNVREPSSMTLKKKNWWHQRDHSLCDADYIIQAQ